MGKRRRSSGRLKSGEEKEEEEEARRGGGRTCKRHVPPFLPQGLKGIFCYLEKGLYPITTPFLGSP